MTSASDGEGAHEHSAGDSDERTRALRRLPGIDRLLDDSGELLARHGRRATTDALRDAVAAARAAVRGGGRAPSPGELVRTAAELLDARRPPPLRHVINATGVVVHTNLGRAPLPDAAREALSAAAGYCDLEYDLETGRRGSRTARLEPLLREATGADAAFAVNNAAAALVLVLAAVAAGRGVVVSRGELIEIGGSFRLPDVMTASGARLIEVGTTNRTRADDYLTGDDVGAILTLHPSNYRIVGFVAQPSLPELVAVATKRQIPLVYDTGSGLLQRSSGPLADEPAVADALRDGADVVLCSGDKLLGGPQAGLLFGRRDLIERCRRHPLARALRLDKLRIAALQATLELHVSQRLDDVPVWRMLTAGDAQLAARCHTLSSTLRAAEVTSDVVRAAGLPGGGSAPDALLDGPVVRIRVGDPLVVADRLRTGRPPVVVRVADDAVLVDPRTVRDADDDVLAERLVAATDRPRR